MRGWVLASWVVACLGAGCADPGRELSHLANQAPVARFGVTPAVPLPGQTVEFTSAATDLEGRIVSQRWEFGDGATASGDTASHGFATWGSYLVRLTVTDDRGLTGTVVQQLVVNEAPVADFAVASTVGAIRALRAVAFTSKATDQDGTVLTWGWDFGDGSTSAERDPRHVYAGPGTYTVRLAVSDDRGQFSLAEKAQEVEVLEPNDLPVASFSVAPRLGAASGEPVSFVSTSTDPDGSVATWAWDFGDQGTAAVEAPTHVYARPGIYTVKLEVRDDRDDPGAAAGRVQVLHPSARVRLAAGREHSLSVGPDGGLWSWGSNFDSQLGGGPGPERWVAWPNAALADVVAVSTSTVATLGLKADGSVWIWGNPAPGQAGGAPPVAVEGLSQAIAVAAGEGHYLAVRADGTVWAWGANDSGQLGDGSTASSEQPVQVGAIADAVAVAAGAVHSLALGADGRVWAWGGNGFGQLGDQTPEARNSPAPVEGLAEVVAVAARDGHNLAVTKAGEVWAWGRNTEGQLGDGTLENRGAPQRVPGIASAVA
ncbi:MAG: RCC1 domain-containing protein, partial [Deferrisomatales bacterium]